MVCAHESISAACFVCVFASDAHPFVLLCLPLCATAGGRYAGEHKGGLREGIGKLQLANGDKYSGNFHNNLQHGRGVYTWSKGDVYDGSWSDVRMHGVGKVSTTRTERHAGVCRQRRMLLQSMCNRSSVFSLLARLLCCVPQYSWPDGIVYIGEWVAGVQSGLGFKCAPPHKTGCCIHRECMVDPRLRVVVVGPHFSLWVPPSCVSLSLFRGQGAG